MTALEKPARLRLAAVSCGGVAAVLAGNGLFSALEFAGLGRLEFYYGASGGAIISAMKSLNYSATELNHISMEDEFARFVDPGAGILGPLMDWSRFVKLSEHLCGISASSGAQREDLLAETELHWSGLMSTRPLGDFIEQSAREKGFGSSWPASYITIATLRDGTPIIFHKNGVTMITLPDPATGRPEETILLSPKPAPLALAVRASGTLPFAITAIRLGKHVLWDGALSLYGYCPVGALIRHFGIEASTVFASRLGEDSTHRKHGANSRMLRSIWTGLPGRTHHWGPETTGVLECRPVIDHLHALSFHPTADQKWLALIASFRVALEALALRGYLSEGKRDEAMRLFAELGYWRDYMPAGKGEPQLLAARAQSVFAEHGLY